INSNNLKENVDYTIYYNDQKQKSWSKTAPNYIGKFNARIVLNENVNKKYYFANEQDCTIQYEIIKNSSPILSNTFTPNGSSYLEKPQTITIKSEFVCGGTYNIYANDELIYTKKIPVITGSVNEFDTYTFTPGDERVYNFKIELNTVYYGFNSQTITKKIEYNGSQQTDVTLEGGKDISYGDEYKVTASGGSSTGNFVYSIINEKKSNNTDATPGSIATIDQNGNVKAVGIGSYQIKVYRNGDETYVDSPAQVSPVLKTEKRKISITGITATDRAYDKTTVVALSGGTVSGILESDASSVTVTIPTTGEITDKNASETSKPVSFSTENILSGEKKDYYVVECDNIPVNITKRSVTIDGITVNNKIYDGTKSTTIKTDGKVSSTLPGESLSFTSGTIEFSTENVGNNIKVIAKDFAISGTDASNYVLESQPTIPDATITKKELTVSVEKISINCGQI
ncbi:MAG: YDG domain-containing protein, partial [Oscillospiraceae bacterium]